MTLVVRLPCRLWEATSDVMVFSVKITCIVCRFACQTAKRNFDPLKRDFKITCTVCRNASRQLYADRVAPVSVTVAGSINSDVMLLYAELPQ